MDADVYAGQVATLLLIAVALGCDAFSLGLGIGLRGIKLKEIARLGFVIGLFHLLMPLGGIVAGQLAGGLLGQLAVIFAGGLLVLLGIHMVYSAFRKEAAQPFDYRSGLGMLAIALSVSADAFSVGVPMGMFSADMWLTVALFGFFGGVMSTCGLLLGRKVGGRLGEYGEALGGVILIAFGVLFIV